MSEAKEARARMIMAATALVLLPGGMTWADDIVTALADALQGVGRLDQGDPVACLIGPCHAIITARLASDDDAFDTARSEARRALAGYWAERVGKVRGT